MKALLTQVEFVLGLPPTFFTHYTLQVALLFIPLARKWLEVNLR